jgi:thioredoxin-like negative regulator of GroEL
MAALSLDQLRGVFVTALDAGFELAAERAATALAARPDATPQDRWESLGALAERAESSVRRLELIGQLRGIAAELKANDGMLDVAELRIRMQRGDEAEATRLLAHLQRDHGADRQVLQALAEVLMEAGVDLNALAGARGGAAASQATAPAAAGKLWTPGGEAPAAGGEQKTIWTPGG